MRDLDRALADTAHHAHQGGEGFQLSGYGPMTVAASGHPRRSAGLAPGSGCRTGDQHLRIPRAVGRDGAIWVALIGTEMVARTRRIHSGLADEMIHAATEQFIPAGVAGALLTFVLFRFAPQSLWMLPGLWQIVFSLGLFASCRSLPRRCSLPQSGISPPASRVWRLQAASTRSRRMPWRYLRDRTALIALVLYRAVGEADAES